MPKKNVNKSQIKRTKQNEKIRLDNKAKKKTFRKTVKATRLQPTEANLKASAKSLDSMAAKGVISKNKAARDKSRLARKLNQASKTEKK